MPHQAPAPQPPIFNLNAYSPAEIEEVGVKKTKLPVLALIMPISAFVAAGFEHCVANMYFLPFAWLMTQTGHAPGFDASPITLSGIIHNLVPVTLGNIVGGAGLAGTIYWVTYRAAFGAANAGEK